MTVKQSQKLFGNFLHSKSDSEAAFSLSDLTKLSITKTGVFALK